MTRYVGIDLHKHLIVGHIIDPSGKKLDTFRYENVNAVTLEHIGRHRLQPEDQVVLEATTHCWAVVRALEPFAARVAVSNPMATKAIAKAKVKTDKVDAAVLAHLLRLGYLAEVWQPDPATRDLREWTARRTRVVGYANGMLGYVPHKEAFAHGGYETTFGYRSKLAPDAGDLLADAAIDLVRSVTK